MVLNLMMRRDLNQATAMMKVSWHCDTHAQRFRSLAKCAASDASHSVAAAIPLLPIPDMSMLHSGCVAECSHLLYMQEARVCVWCWGMKDRASQETHLQDAER